MICAPHGGLFANRVLKNRCGVSKNTPQPARMLVLPSPPGVQIAPRRGANCAILLLVVPRPGYPSSPGNINPAGACGYTVLLIPASKRAWSKLLAQL